MHVVVAGGGRTAVYLSKLLLDQGHTLRVIEYRPDVLDRLHTELATEVIVVGNPLDEHILLSADIRRANVFLACTPDDSDNLILCYEAHELHKVPRTLAWINNPRHAWLFNSRFGVDFALNQADVLAKLVEEEMSLGDMMVLLKFQQGEYSLVEEMLPPNAPAVGKAIKELELPGNSAVTAILRGGRIVVPHGDTVFEAGDEVYALVDRGHEGELAVLLAGRK